MRKLRLLPVKSRQMEYAYCSVLSGRSFGRSRVYKSESDCEKQTKLKNRFKLIVVVCDTLFMGQNAMGIPLSLLHLQQTNSNTPYLNYIRFTQLNTYTHTHTLHKRIKMSPTYS